MKKHFLQFIAISAMFCFAACTDSVAKETKSGSDSDTKSSIGQPEDSVKKTTISIGPNGTGIKTKTTDVQLDKTGVKVGTKDVNVDVKTGK